ncbi:hypothetical protein [Candidatus Stoquefichus massiliensis]|uniref:hypothetical protein n=1 Tax=Candidatus Stoquefichus massiliensis TaxID=1470350 RepID=UPI00048A052D|nr:hypothetical protein [Candidatus Stoquefichus massiliensis]
MDSITKGTNRGSSDIGKRKAGRKRKENQVKTKGQDVKVIDYADKAVIRLQKKYQRKILRGVNRNIAITAIARELACFVWRVETGNIA